MTGRIPVRSGTTAIPLPGRPSGLVTWERTIAELLGALMGLAQVPADDTRREEWRRAGAERMADNSAQRSRHTTD